MRERKSHRQHINLDLDSGAGLSFGLPTKRELVRAASAAVLVATIGIPATIGAKGAIEYNENHTRSLGVDWEKNTDVLTFDEAAQLTLETGKAYKDLGLKDWRINYTDEFLNAWVYETSVQMQAEGIAKEAVTPDQLGAYVSQDGMETNHLSGFTDCQRFIAYNIKYRNPVSQRYDDPDLLGTLVHEMVHFEGEGPRCADSSSVSLESTAQVGMLETLAGMAMRDNRYAFRAFVSEAYSMADGALLALAVRDNRVDDYMRIHRQIEGSAFDDAAKAKMWMDWQGATVGENSLNDVLQKYELVPMQMIVTAHLKNKDVVSGVPLNIGAQEIKLDDWAYIMAHLAELVKEEKGKGPIGS